MYYIVLYIDALPCLDIVLYKSVHFIWIWTGNTALQDFYLGCHHPICDVCVLPMNVYVDIVDDWYFDT